MTRGAGAGDYSLCERQCARGNAIESMKIKGRGLGW